MTQEVTIAPPPQFKATGPEILVKSVVEALKTCYDPEIPIDIYELGLIYELNINDAQEATLQMTLTSPMCPVAGSLPPEVEKKVAQVYGITKAAINIVWEPTWSPAMMSEVAKTELGM